MGGETSGLVQSRARGGIVAALNREWELLDDRHRDTVDGWAVRHDVFSACRVLSDVLAAVRSDPDMGLHALLAEFARGQQMAGRVVLQSLLGRLVNMAGRDARAGVDDYVTALWCELAVYPLSRRPTRIAANLALDTLQAVRREHRWVVRGEVATWPPGDSLDEILHRSGLIQRNHNEGSGPVVAEVLAAARHLRLIDASGYALLTSVYLDGLTGVEAAQRHRTTPGTVRVRCSRAVGRMTVAAAELLEVA